MNHKYLKSNGSLLLGLAALGGGALGHTAGCAAPEHHATTARTDLPRYTAEEAALFDDSIAPEVFGLPRGGVPAHRDPKLIERTRLADGVIRARVATVTEDGRGTYTLVVRPAGPPLVGPPPPDTVEIRLEERNPAIPLLRAAGGRLMGRTLVLFLRYYEAAGAPRQHFRAEADSPHVEEAVKRANLLDDLAR